MVPAAVIEGPVLTMICGFLYKMGYLAFIPTYLLLMFGDILGDVIWYGIGYYGGRPFVRRFGKYFSVTEEKITTVEKFFHTHSDKILIISKITNGFGFALVTLMTAGIVKISFKRYMILNTIGQFIWTGTLLALGYFFGNVYETMDGIFAKISLFAMIAIALALFFGIGKYMKERVTATSEKPL
ncbi:MAG: DedA family protein [Patescibacteria group bacterium]